MGEVLGGASEALEVDGDAEVGAEVVGAPKENFGAAVVDPEEVEGELPALAAGLATPKPVKPPKGLAFAGGCEAALVLAGDPKLNEGVGVDGAGAVDEGALPKPTLPPRVANGLAPPGAPKEEGDDDAAPKATGLAADDPGVPGSPFLLGSPRMTLPAAGVACIEPCEDGESSSDASSPSSLRICFSAWRFMEVGSVGRLQCWNGAYRFMPCYAEASDNKKGQVVLDDQMGNASDQARATKHRQPQPSLLSPRNSSCTQRTPV